MDGDIYDSVRFREHRRRLPLATRLEIFKGNRALMRYKRQLEAETYKRKHANESIWG
jgi:hypothetical protein